MTRSRVYLGAGAAAALGLIATLTLLGPIVVPPQTSGGSTADALSTTGAPVDVAAGAPGVAGNVLTLTDATHATWQAASGGGDTLFETYVETPQQNTTYTVTHDNKWPAHTGFRYQALCNVGNDDQLSGGPVPDWVLDDAPTKAGHFTVAPTPPFGAAPVAAGSILTIGAEVGTVVTWPADPTVAGSVILDTAVSSGTPTTLTGPDTYGPVYLGQWNNASPTQWKVRRTPGSNTTTDFRWSGGGQPPAKCTFQVWQAP